MIDPLAEKLLLPREATRYFPPGPSGRTLHVAAIYRYMSTGVRGVVLESLDAPRKCTSKEAVARFLRRLSDKDRQPTDAPIGGLRRPNDRAVEAELDRLGI
jgi:Protein of unknown function (DUF1580)